jgi:hypothetical protein
MSKLKIYTFKDLNFLPHTVLPGGKQAKLEFPDKTNVSVIGGPNGCYGDGDITFEVWYSDEEEPRKYQSIKDIDKEFALRSMSWRGMI